MFQPLVQRDVVEKTQLFVRRTSIRIQLC